MNPRANNEEKFRSRRHRITIERQIIIPPFRWIAWSRVCTTWAEIQNENLITIRYQPDLWPGMRVSVGNRYFEIIGVVDRPGKTRLVELHVQETGKSSAIELRAAADLPDAQRR